MAAHTVRHGAVCIDGAWKPAMKAVNRSAWVSLQIRLSAPSGLRSSPRPGRCSPWRSPPLAPERSSTSSSPRPIHLRSAHRPGGPIPLAIAGRLHPHPRLGPGDGRPEPRRGCGSHGPAGRPRRRSPRGRRGRSRRLGDRSGPRHQRVRAGAGGRVAPHAALAVAARSPALAPPTGVSRPVRRSPNRAPHRPAPDAARRPSRPSSWPTHRPVPNARQREQRAAVAAGQLPAAERADHG